MLTCLKKGKRTTQKNTLKQDRLFTTRVTTRAPQNLAVAWAWRGYRRSIERCEGGLPRGEYFVGYAQHPVEVAVDSVDAELLTGVLEADRYLVYMNEETGQLLPEDLRGNQFRGQVLELELLVVCAAMRSQTFAGAAIDEHAQEFEGTLIVPRGGRGGATATDLTRTQAFTAPLCTPQTKKAGSLI